jgi:hypothetical protein
MNKINLISKSSNEKIYDKKICQYSLDGKLLNVFDDRYKAATHVNSHPDSVISCCIGKYKTSGGFVFRFEGEPFNINKKKYQPIITQ